MPAINTFVSVEEYLNTSYEDGDRDYADGELVERDLGELPHSTIQGELHYWLRSNASRLQVLARIEIRVQINPTRYRVADVAVWRKGDIGDRIPNLPPVCVIEVLSPKDRMERVVCKLQEYLAAGVRYVWLVDPLEGTALLYTPDNPSGSIAPVLRTEDPDIELPLSVILNPPE